MPLMWTPPNADPIVQSVDMEKARDLTAEDYLALLHQRLTRMEKAATPDDEEYLAAYLDARGVMPAETLDRMMMQLEDTSSVPLGLVPRKEFSVKKEQMKLERMERPTLTEYLGRLVDRGK